MTMHRLLKRYLPKVWAFWMVFGLIYLAFEMLM